LLHRAADNGGAAMLEPEGRGQAEGSALEHR
jgi:hypothetical protein